MTVGTLVRRGIRRLAGWWWRSVRPSSAAVLRDTGPARPEHETGRPPRPTERWRPTTPATGPWASIDPQATPQWPRRTSLAVVAVWGGLVAVRVRRGLAQFRD